MSTRSDHVRLDERSLALHCRIAEKLRDDPALVQRARLNLERWRVTLDNPPWAQEWREIVDGPLDKLLEFLTERSEKAGRLRQSSPFAGVLTNEERKEIYESFTARAHHSGS